MYKRWLILGVGLFACGTKPPAATVATQQAQPQLAPPVSAPSTPAAATDGNWYGVLDVGEAKLRLQLTINSKDAKLVSLDQGGVELPIVLQLDKAIVSFTAAAVRADFKGVRDGDTIVGNFSQGGATYPLTFTRGSTPPVAAPAKVRPQDPTDTPYDIQEVAFPGGASDVVLAGTITRPRGTAPVAAVVLISGSGPQDRNEEVMGHRPFLVLADALTRAGVMVLRFDDRGVAKSTGKFETATSNDFALDVWAAVQFLQSRSDVKHDRIGLAGHSEGGLIAPMVAVAHREVAFVVMIAGPAISGDKIIVDQVARISNAGGRPADAGASLEIEFTKLGVEIAKKPTSDDAARKELTEVFTKRIASLPPDDAKLATASLNDMITPLVSPWMRNFLRYDPAPTLSKVKQPLLAVWGSHDTQVAPEINLPVAKRALKQNARATLQVLPGLNHLLQTSTTGSPSEYANIDETIAPAALSLITAWVVKQSK
jgi:hypothetical protein